MNPSTLRLLMPQWQGGNNAAYPLGAQLLAWLAPSGHTAFVEVPVEPYCGIKPAQENGIVAREALLKQLHSAQNIIAAYEPDKIVVFGGDCLVEQAPIAYLNERYHGKLGVLWLDAHPDMSTPKEFPHAHTMVLGHLLGEGDAQFTGEVKMPLNPQLVMFGGLQETTAQETEAIERLGIRRAASDELEVNSDVVINWLKENQIRHLAIHLDLDVLSPQIFRSLLFTNPEPDTFMDFPMGQMNFAQLSRLVSDVSAYSEIVGLGITEFMPWDIINLKELLNRFRILK